METAGETERVDEYGCGFCMGIIIAPSSNYPDACPHCNVKFCNECLTANKCEKNGTVVFCYGCGKINPEVRARINRTSNFSCFYMDEEWRQKNLGRYADGPYTIGTGFVGPKAEGPISSWIYKRGADGKMERVRELTPEEKDVLRKHDESRKREQGGG
jgi:hypothetical protein